MTSVSTGPAQAFRFDQQHGPLTRAACDVGGYQIMAINRIAPRGLLDQPNTHRPAETRRGFRGCVINLSLRLDATMTKGTGGGTPRKPEEHPHNEQGPGR